MAENIESSFENDNNSVVVPVIEEKLHVSKVNEVIGSVKLVKTVKEEAVPFSVELQSERLETKTIPFNTWIDSPVPATRQEGNTTIISVVKEVLVVKKRLMLVEEIHIVRVTESHIKTGSDIVRIEKVDVSRS